MEIRASDEKSSNFMPKQSTSVSFFTEIFKNRCFMKNRWSTITPSPAIHLLHFIDLWHHRNVFELQKILIAQTNVHVSRNQTICDQKISIACRAFVRKITPALVLLYKHSALRVMCWSKRDAARQWNSRQRRKIIEFHAQTVHQRKLFIKFS